jgi:hypothetical protein
MRVPLPPPIPPRETLAEIRNQIINGVLEASESGALCSFPSEVTIESKNAHGSEILFTFAVIPTAEEWARLKAAHGKLALIQ